jgi:hypothetical protein
MTSRASRQSRINAAARCLNPSQGHVPSVPAFLDPRGRPAAEAPAGPGARSTARAALSARSWCPVPCVSDRVPAPHQHQAAARLRYRAPQGPQAVPRGLFVRIAEHGALEGAKHGHSHGDRHQYDAGNSQRVGLRSKGTKGGADREAGWGEAGGRPAPAARTVGVYRRLTTDGHGRQRTGRAGGMFRLDVSR